MEEEGVSSLINWNNTLLFITHLFFSIHYRTLPISSSSLSELHLRLVHLLPKDVRTECWLLAEEIGQLVGHVHALPENGVIHALLVGQHWKHHRRGHVETEILLRLIGIHRRQVVRSARSETALVYALLQLLRFDLSRRQIAFNGIVDSHQNIAHFGVKSCSLAKLPVEAVDVIELAHHLLKLFLAFVVSLVASVQTAWNLSHPSRLGLNQLWLLVEGLNQLVSAWKDLL